MISRLVLRGIRVHDEAVIDFPEGLGVIFGPNGSGKTTILEAIFLLCTLKSFRTSKTSEIISTQKERASVEAKFNAPDQVRKIEINPRSKALYKNHGKTSSVESFLEGASVVCLSPEHQTLVHGGPEGRRRYLDHILFSKNPAYLEPCRRYHRAVKQKAALLKQKLPKKNYVDAVLPWEHEMASSGEIIRSERIRLVGTLETPYKAQYASISGSAEEVAMDYDFSGASLRDEMAEKRDAEYYARRVLAGPHRDDLKLSLRRGPARDHASQGETSSIILSLKMCELLHLEQALSNAPILLLDDVGGTLDENRRNNLFKWVDARQGTGAAKQVIMTTADPGTFAIASRKNGREIKVNQF